MAVNRIGIKNADGQIVYTDISVKAENVRGKIAEAAVADKVAHTLTINGKAFDGSEDVSVTASGGGGDVGVEITQADYNALPEDEKMNGTTYFIIDEQNISADNISYDNSATGLVAKTVQDAIDKIAKNGGGGAIVDPGVYLTQEEYDNLSEEEKNNDTLYYIEDTNDGEVRAANIRYEDNDGILEATNMQDAIDLLGKMLKLDFSKASTTVQDVNTFLQKTLEKLFPLVTEYVYQMGNELSSNYSTFTYPNQTFNNTEQGYYFKCNVNQNYGAYIHSNNLIDVTNINKIIVEVDVATLSSTTEYNGIYIGVSEDKNYSATFTKHVIGTNTGAYTIECDLSEVTGNYYFKLCIGSTNNEGYIKNIYFA